MGPSESVETYQDDLERIEAAVDAGETDLGRLGFWRLLSKIKGEPVLSPDWAEVAGRIDRKAFEARVRWRFPVWLGTAALVFGTIVGAFALGVALGTDSETVAGIALLVTGGVWSVSLHDLAHWLTGRVVGIRFTSYFIGGPFPPRPGLKIDYATYLRADPVARAWMHASGAIVTKLAPFAALACWPATEAPAWAAWGLIALGALELVTDAFFSVRSSDWKKVRRELGVARRQAANR